MVRAYLVSEGGTADAEAVKLSVGYKRSQFQFGWNRLDLSIGWPVLTA